MSQASSDQPPARNDLRTRAPAAKSSGSFLWWMTLGTLALMFLADLPNEFVRWKHAAAIVARDANDKERAYELLAQAYGSRKEDPKYIEQELAWRLDDEDYEAALPLLNRSLDKPVTEPGLKPTLIALRSHAYLHLDRGEEAVADCLEINQMSVATGEPRRAVALNGLAYVRAVARLDLGAAERDIDIAVPLARAEVEQCRRKLRELPFGGLLSMTNYQRELLIAERTLTMLLDTRGFVLLHQDRLLEARADMNEAIQRYQRFRATDSQLTSQSARHARSYRDYVRAKESEDRGLAILYYHRYLVHKKLGDRRAAAIDFERARKLLGREPDESVF